MKCIHCGKVSINYPMYVVRIRNTRKKVGHACDVCVEKLGKPVSITHDQHRELTAQLERKRLMINLKLRQVKNASGSMLYVRPQDESSDTQMAAFKHLTGGNITVTWEYWKRECQHVALLHDYSVEIDLLEESKK